MENTEELLRGFAVPDGDYRPATMWFITDELSEEEITAQLESFSSKGINDFFFNPESGFVDEYLGERYFEIVRHTVREAKRLGLGFWIYDEFRYPSGIAGGLLIRDHPELRARVLCDEKRTLGPGFKLRRLYVKGRFLRAFRSFGDDKAPAVDVTDSVTVEPCGDGFYISWSNERCGSATLHIMCERLQENVLAAGVEGKFTFCQDGYIDPLREEAMRAFIDYTHERYKAAVGDEFGKTVKGVFTDEVCVGDPHELGSGRVPWNDELTGRFRERFGYDVTPWLYALVSTPRNPREKMARYHFWRLLTERVRDAHIKQVYEWCDREGLKYTGHFDGEESLVWSMYQSGDIFDLMEWMHVPGIDSIFSRDKIGDENFNVAGKILSSSARFFGRKRTLCETYTGSSYRLRFDEMRRIANRLMILGVNMIQYMGAAYSMDNQRKSWKPSFGYNNTMFERFDLFGDYIARIQYISAHSAPAGRVLMMCPQSGVYSNFDGHSHIFQAYYDATKVAEYDRTNVALVNALLELNIEYDMFSDSMAEKVLAEDGHAVLCGAEYDAVILPNAGDTTSGVMAMAERLKQAGVKLIFVNELPQLMVDRAEQAAPFGEKPEDKELRCIADNVYFFSEENVNKIRVNNTELKRKLKEALGDGLRTLDIRHSGDVLTALRRGDGGETVVFLCNDGDTPRSADFACAEGMRLLDPDDGTELPLHPVGGRAVLELEAHKLYILLCGCGEALPAKADAKTETLRTLYPDCGFAAQGGNILAARWSYSPGGGEELIPLNAEGMIPARYSEPCRKGRLIFDFEAEFVPETATLFAEYGDVISCELNGVRIDDRWQKCRLWGPKDAKLDVAGLLRQGRNRLEAVIENQDFCMNYFVPFMLIRGDFETDGASILKKRESYLAAPTEAQGYPQLCGAGSYTFTAELGAKEAEEAAAVSVESLDACELFVNGVSAGTRLWAPYRFDTRGLFREGANTLELRLTLPMHNIFCEPDERIAVGLAGAPRLEKLIEKSAE